jgi:hypothetical protein
MELALLSIGVFIASILSFSLGITYGDNKASLRYAKELSQLAIETYRRELQVAKLEAEINQLREIVAKSTED